MGVGRLAAILGLLILGLAAPASADQAAQLAAQASPVGGYRHFRAAIYITVSDTRRLADRATFDREFARLASQLRFDKVYIEAYRDRVVATDDELERVKAWFRERGIATAGGVTLAAGGQGGQFGTFDYEDAADRAGCERAVRLIARHFDEVILDDFFFYTSKSDADIAARGTRSWTRYRLDRMREVARDLVIAPARAVNPRVRLVIKYPNWYEHFQGLGYECLVKTTGCEAMFIHAIPGVPAREIFLHRPYDKATVWEQRDVLSLASRLDERVFLWECMALQPDLVNLLQAQWMRDD